MPRTLLAVVALALLSAGCATTATAPPDTPEVVSAIEEAAGSPPPMRSTRAR